MFDTIERDGMKKGDWVLVTGAGGGLGRAIARRLSVEGARVALWDIDDSLGHETEAMIRDAGGETRYQHVDLAQPDAITTAARQDLEAWGTPFGIVNNAGIFPRYNVLEMPLAAWEMTLRVNLTSQLVIAQAFGPSMIDARRGVIVNIASGRAVEGTPNGASYACSKAGIVSFTKTLALEWAQHNIRVNGVIPGVAETAQPLANTTVDELRSRGKSIPLGRIGQPDDMAGLVAFFMSSDAAYMTGQSVAMNGGKIMLP